ncbi:hypothetical protein CONPUDRAFT_145096 [Coniophora puteana RWD-64-598 SS2]|uniref:Protein-S-isoprenylcysteine O-methyltransferase n=1 Tax=Coniophora puteana (strain RWD-64-598) TaxID=741705 RepID=A0A5M3MIZ9_CONPW|nr:uncharacterized protein CONPUDRAFT_145096 [Coniophora puteana RWD-64-598 SS2]EIW78764.1 hypothetical protein CONPUDRAFT_145096 [Coniophora puteana RWD-64-598 SS2]
MTLPLVKVPFLLASLYYFNRILISPETPQKEERVKTTWHDSYAPKVFPWTVRNGKYPNLHLTSQFLLGAVIATLFGHLRVECFRTLGRHFTFEMSLRRKHELITHGPYSVVRHPSYTTGIIAFFGMSLVIANSGSWLLSSGWLNVWQGKTMAGVWVFFVAYAVFTTVVRAQKEDDMLSEHFGNNWEAYAKKVSCRMIPYIW